MSKAAAKDSLVVIVEGEEVPGVIVYGLRAAGSENSMGRLGVSPLGRAAQEHLLAGDAWEIHLWEYPIETWPQGDDWQLALRITLRAIIEAGARISWIGAEGLPFCDPPELFSVDCMEGGVLAWMKSSGEFGCLLDPNEPVRSADREVLADLRQYASGLADVS